MKTKPTEYDGAYWIGVDSPFKKNNPQLHNSNKLGKWMLFVPVEKINETWKLIFEETQQGRLGFSSKVSTHLGWLTHGKGADYVICVHTKDYNDQDDIFRVRQRLLELGFVDPLKYKTDQSTFQANQSFLYEK